VTQRSANEMCFLSLRSSTSDGRPKSRMCLVKRQEVVHRRSRGAVPSRRLARERLQVRARRPRALARRRTWCACGPRLSRSAEDTFPLLMCILSRRVS
jgi:hypothetical protein